VQPVNNLVSLFIVTICIFPFKKKYVGKAIFEVDLRLHILIQHSVGENIYDIVEREDVAGWIKVT